MAANTVEGWLTMEARKGKKKKKKSGGLALLLFAGLGAAALIGIGDGDDGDDGGDGTGWTKADSDAHGGAKGAASGCVKPTPADCVPEDDPQLGTIWEIADLPEIRDMRGKFFIYGGVGTPAIVKKSGDTVTIRWRVKNVGDVAGTISMGWGNCFQSFCAVLYGGRKSVQPGQEVWVEHVRSVGRSDLGNGFTGPGNIFLRASDCNGNFSEPVFGIVPTFSPPGSLTITVDLANEHPELFAPRIDGRIQSVLVSQVNDGRSIIRGRQEGFNLPFRQGFGHGSGLPGETVSGGSGGILHGMVDRNR